MESLLHRKIYWHWKKIFIFFFFLIIVKKVICRALVYLLLKLFSFEFSIPTKLSVISWSRYYIFNECLTLLTVYTHTDLIEFKLSFLLRNTKLWKVRN